MNVIDIFTIGLLFAATCLCIALIIYLKRIAQSFDSLKDEVKTLSDEIKPLINSVMDLSDNLNRMSADLKEPIQTAKGIINNIKYRVDKILEVEEKIRGGFENSVSGMIKNLSSVANGVSTFWKTFRKNSQ
jgi:uncharacterized protein YoxC